MPSSWTILGVVVASVVIYWTFGRDGDRDRDSEPGPPPHHHSPATSTSSPASSQRIFPPQSRLQESTFHRPSHSVQPERQRHRALSEPDPEQSPRDLYKSLRTRARAEGDNMNQSFERSRLEKSQGRLDMSSRWEDQGREHKLNMEGLDKAASNLIFQENNKERRPDEVDLHDLFVKEAEERVRELIRVAQQRGNPTQIRLIVGQGLHASDGIPKIKPAIESLIRERRLAVKCDPRNPGVLIVRLDGRGFAETAAVR